jgi:alkylation response protein AidB-like acyl-CoA dehydrogenase
MFTPSETGALLANSVSQAITQTGMMPGKHDAEASRRLWAALAGLGLPGIEIGTKHGGSGGALADLAPALSVLGKTLSPAPVLSSVVGASWLLSAAGSPDQADALLTRLSTGSLIAAVAHEEHAARGHPHFVETRAVHTPDGWTLDGAKHVVPDGGLAGLFIVSARSAGAAGDPEGLSLFLVPADTPGLTCRRFELYDGSGSADLSFTGMTLPATALLGPHGAAAPLLEAARDRCIAALCAEATGVMEGLFELTADYVRTREQFGQPIGKFQVIQHRMADMFIELQLAKSMAAFAIASAGLQDAAQRSRAVSAAKYAVSNAARMIGQSAVQLHGGIALTEEYAAGHYFKRLTRIERQFGNADHHLDRFAGLAA